MNGIRTLPQCRNSHETTDETSWSKLSSVLTVIPAVKKRTHNLYYLYFNFGFRTQRFRRKGFARREWIKLSQCTEVGPGLYLKEVEF